MTQETPNQASATLTAMAPGWARMVLGLFGALTAVSALGMAVASVTAGPKPAFQLLGFEIVSVVAGLMALWMSRGKASEGFGLAVLGIAGAIGAGAVLSYMSVTSKHDFLRPSGKFGSLPLWPWFYLRVGTSAILVATAALSVLLRKPKSLIVLTKGVLIGVPAMAAGGYLALMVKNGKASTGSLQGFAAVAATTGVLVAGVAIITALAIGGHLVIRAFEMGRTDSKA